VSSLHLFSKVDLAQKDLFSLSHELGPQLSVQCSLLGGDKTSLLSLFRTPWDTNQRRLPLCSLGLHADSVPAMSMMIYHQPTYLPNTLPNYLTDYLPATYFPC